MTGRAATPAPGGSAIPALTSRGPGHQFVCYADCCSGVPGASHEAAFAAVNAVVARLRPRPEFIAFPGDEVIGLTADVDALRRQWRHWLDVEMAWLDPSVPVFHATGNHTTYDAAAEAVFREVLTDLPRNGPPGQEGLSYFVRRGDLLLVCVNTLWSGLGEGRVETAWLERTLAAHADARYRLVMGHHPVFPVNGFSGPFQRDIAPEDGRAFWDVLVRHGVLAYLCSHILAFDVQVHDGVLQLLTAGAATSGRMPPETEYLHAVQLALDGDGLRYQVLDTEGSVREWLSWPPALPPSAAWDLLPVRDHPAPVVPRGERGRTTTLVGWRFRGVAAPTGSGEAQSLVSAWNPGPALAPLWVGLLGPEQRLGVLIAPEPGRSPHLWYGPTLAPGAPFDLQLALHGGMGPGGVLWRRDDGAPWSSLTAASPWGAERLAWPSRESVGHAQRGPRDRPFRGRDLAVGRAVAVQRLA
ncbi:MAG TPA: metallophosphoesterase [Thermomicrobiaceae bacterium]|nr:metallophosphoesterase [Thermomicrobiaceae bacterium]